jgi:type II secretory pathway pseudopilin PulG
MMRRRPAGFFIADMIFAMAILGMLLAIFAGALSWRQRVAAKLAGSRAACRDAERVLLELNQGVAGKSVDQPPGSLKIEPVTAGQPVAGYAWVRVSVHENGSSASLVGLAAASALEGK